MDKLLIFPGKSDKGIFTYLIDTEHLHLIKTAAEYHPTIAAYIHNAKPIPGKTQILLTALGAGEWWGHNVNGDYFPEEALAHEGPTHGYKTFESHAKIYKHHINKDPTAAYGDVALSVYNPRYHRVELIVILDNAKAPDIAQRIEEGDYPDWSMGCKVPYDICNNCGNKAPTVKQYCDCLKYYMGRQHPETGKMCIAINTLPLFFDISQVLIGADKISKTLKKVASQGRPAPSSALLALKMAEYKQAEIEKEVPATPPASQDSIEDLVASIPEIKAREPMIGERTLNLLGRKFPINEIFSTMSLMGILPKPQEFQRIILVSAGKKDIADQLSASNMTFNPEDAGEILPAHEKILPISHEHFNPSIMDLLKDYAPDRSYAAPHLGRRLVMFIKMGHIPPAENVPRFIKISDEAKQEHKPLGIVPTMLLLSTLYALLARKAPGEAAGHIDRLIEQHPGLMGALGAAIPLVFNQMAGSRNKGNFTPMPAGSPDTNDMAHEVAEMSAKPMLKISGKLFGPAATRIFGGIPLAFMSSSILQKHHDTNPSQEEGMVTKFIRKNPDVIALGLAIDASLARRGKGTHAFFKGAEASDFLGSGVDWPDSSGSSCLASRMIGGLFDQAVLVSSKDIAKKFGK